MCRMLNTLLSPVLLLASTSFITSARGQSTIVSDDFHSGILNTSIWTFVNPGTPSVLAFTGIGTEDARLTLAVPAGTSHDVWLGGNFAPRIMQNCNDSDFEVEVKFESPMTAGYQIQGILVQESTTKFIRFDFVRDPYGMRVFAATFTGGSPTTRYDRYVTQTMPMYLRVKRVGNQWTQRFSSDGTNWTTAASFSFSLGASSVGVFAGNAGSPAPAFTSAIDYFFNTSSPISPEDPTAPPSPPMIVTQPLPQTVDDGATATFTVSASGTLPLSYQWQKNGAAIGGAANPTYTTTATVADNGTTYRCIVTNGAGSVTSSSALLTVRPLPPSITRQPANQVVQVGQPATFVIEASGSSHLSFQWQRNGVPISGASSSQYTLPATSRADSGALFRCVVESPYGTATSDAALLSVNAAPTGAFVSDDFNSSSLNTNLWTFINPGTPSQLGLTGTGTQNALLAIDVPSGSSHDVWTGGNFAPRIMQACRNSDFQVEVKFQSAPGRAYQLQGIIIQQDAANYLRFDFYHDGGSLRLFAASFVNNSPSVRYNVPIATSGTLFLRVTRQGNQWTQRYSTDGTAWINGASFSQALTVTSIGPFVGNAGFAPPAFTGLIDYFFNTASPLLPEDGDRTPPSISTIAITPSTQSALVSWNTNEPATGAVAYGLTNAYELGRVESAVALLAQSMQLTGLVPGRTYHARIIARDSAGNEAQSNDLTFTTIAAGVSITQHPADTLIRVGRIPTFRVKATGTPPLVFQWLRNGSPIAGATDSIYIMPAATLADSGARFSCVVSNGFATDTSNAATLHVAIPPTITLQPASQSVPEGGTATFRIAADGSKPFSYQWQKNGVNIPGATSDSLTTGMLSAADSGSAYRCIVTNIVGSDTSVAAILSVHQSAGIVQQPASQFVRVGSTATFLVRARGTPPLVFQWFRNDTLIVGATDSIYTTSTLTLGDSGAIYKCIVQNSVGTDTSNAATLHVAIPPTITLQPASQSVPEGGTATFRIAADGSKPFSYQWQKNGVNIPGATSDSLTTGMLSAADSGSAYRCIVTNVVGSDTSESALVLVYIPATIVAQPSNQRVSSGSTATFLVRARGTPPLVFQWFRNDTLIVGTTDSIYTTSTVTLADSGSRYKCIVHNTFGADTSQVAELSVGVLPSITLEPDDRTAAEGDTVRFFIVAEGDGLLSYLWYINHTADSSATRDTLVLPSVSLADHGTTVFCVVSNADGADTSRLARLWVQAPARIVSHPGSVNAALGASASFAITARGSSPLSYQWLRNAAPIAGAIDSVYTTPSVTAADDSTIFQCVVGNNLGMDTSNVALLRVFLTPNITVEPVNQTVSRGSAAYFYVIATGTEPLQYQWFRHGMPIPAATQHFYAIGSTTSADSGALFRCVVSNAAGNDTSLAAQLTVTPLGVTVVSDDFSSPTLNTTLWQFVNPQAPSTLTLVGTGTENAYVNISVPEGSGHDVWTSGNHAPRLMQQAPDTDFEIEVKFLSRVDAAYQLQGVIVEQDSLNFLRFDVYHDGNSPRAFAAAFVGGYPHVQYNQPISMSDVLYLRVIRRGNGWTQKYSFNGQTWMTAAQFMQTLNVRSVGPFAGNAGYPDSSTPPFEGKLDYFFNMASPIIPEDSIRIPTLPVITKQPGGRTIIAGSTATFEVEASGSAPLFYQWQRNGTAIPGATQSSVTIPSVSLSDSGSAFRCVVSNLFGTTTSNSALLIVRSTLNGTLYFVNRIVDENNPRSTHCKTVGDVDGDGYNDILAASGRNNQEGLFWYRYPTWSKYKIAPGSFSTDMQATDMDGDGDTDAIISKGNDLGVSVWWYENPLPAGNPAAGGWIEHYLGDAICHDLEVGDINKDGKPDVVARHAGAALFLSSGVKSWQQVNIDGRWAEGTALADLDSDGDLDVLNNGGWMQNPLPNGNPADDTQWTYYVIDHSWESQVGVGTGDLNGDGRTDVLFAPSHNMSQKGLYWFEQPASVSGNWIRRAIDTSVHAIHVVKTADINADGFLDVIAAEMFMSEDPDEVNIFLGDGTGQVWTKMTIDEFGSHNIRVADIGNDGDLDIIGANGDEEALDGSVVEYWENLLVQPTLPLTQWQRHVIDSTRAWQPLFVATGDMNNDMKLDIVTGGWWYRNPETPGASWTKTTIGAPLNNMVLAFDFDSDGDTDVLGTQGQGPQANPLFSWARNAGNGTFTILNNIQQASGDFPQGATIRRFGINTLYEVGIAWNNKTTGVHMWTVPDNPSAGTWSRRVISTTSQGEQLTAKDIDRDRNIDILLGTQWLERNSTGFSLHTLASTILEPDRNRLADINNDGRLDAIVGFESPNIAGKLVWYEQPSSPIGLWTEHVIASSVIGPMSLDVADMDHDGDLDIVVGEHYPDSPDSARLLIFENADFYGTSWRMHVVHSGDEHHDGAHVADIEGDGDLDIVSISWARSLVLLYENMAIGGGTFARSVAAHSTTRGPDAPLEYALHQSYPNPFNPTAMIRYETPREGRVTLQVFNVLGQLVATLVDAEQKAGRYEVTFDGSRYASGTYFYRMTAESFVQVKKMLLVK